MFVVCPQKHTIYFEDELWMNAVLQHPAASWMNLQILALFLQCLAEGVEGTLKPGKLVGLDVEAEYGFHLA